MNTRHYVKKKVTGSRTTPCGTPQLSVKAQMRKNKHQPELKILILGINAFVNVTIMKNCYHNLMSEILLIFF